MYLKPTPTGTKRDFSILESQSEIETEQNESDQCKEPNDSNGKVKEKEIPARKPPPIFFC